MSKKIDTEILSLVFAAKRDAYEKLGLSDEAAIEHARAADLVAKAGKDAYHRGRYRDALRLFRKLQGMLEEWSLWRDVWGEVYLIIASCCLKQKDPRAAQEAFVRAYLFEPDNEKLLDIASRLGLKWSGLARPGACGACGVENARGARFCKGCGKPLASQPK